MLSSPSIRKVVSLALLVVPALVDQDCAARPTPTPVPTPTHTPALTPTAASAATGVPQVSVEEVKARLDSGQSFVLVDVREPADYKDSHIGGAISIPVDALAGRFGEIPRGREVIVYTACS